MIRSIIILIIFVFLVIESFIILFFLGVKKNKPTWLQELEDEEQMEYLKEYQRRKEERKCQKKKGKIL